MKQNCIVVFANPYSFTDERTGDVRKGVSVQYLLTDTLKPVQNDDNSRGTRISKSSIDFEKAPHIQAVPGIYECEFGMKSTSNGTPKLELIDLEFVQALTPTPDPKK